MYSFDASSMIHAWDNYPPENPLFSALWGWVAEEISNEEFCISEIALDEVGHKIPECGVWLKNKDIKIYPLTPSILSRASQIKALLGIKEEQYGKGVGENDLFIIATSKEIGAILATEEKRQNSLPQLKPNYKVPAVCNMPEVNVDCSRFVDLLK